MRLRRLLIPRARVITPNLPEAAALLDAPIAANENEMQAQAQRLLALGAKAVLIKGGHGSGPESVDLLVETKRRCAARGAARRNAQHPRHRLHAVVGDRGGACQRGARFPTRCATAKYYVTAAIGAADKLAIGKGHGPVHHFHQWW